MATGGLDSRKARRARCERCDEGDAMPLQSCASRKILRETKFHTATKKVTTIFDRR